MTYIPTEEELIELQFSKRKSFCWSYYTLELGDNSVICFSKSNNGDKISWEMVMSSDYGETIYPQSKSDIEILIRLFTPNE